MRPTEALLKNAQALAKLGKSLLAMSHWLQWGREPQSRSRCVCCSVATHGAIQHAVYCVPLIEVQFVWTHVQCDL